MAFLLTAVAIAAAGIGVASATTDNPVILLGSHQTSKAVRGQSAGRAMAFRFTAARAGDIAAVWVYVARNTRASSVSAAIYSNASGRPRARLGSGIVRHFRQRRWVRIKLGSVPHLHAGSTYWLALLGSRGRLAYRTSSGRACGSHVVALGKDRLSGRWQGAGTRSGCRPAVYVNGSQGVSAPTPGPKPPAPSPPTTTTTHTTTTTPPSAPPGSQKNCAPTPSACGYPDQKNSGVPAGTALTPRTGNVTAGTAGQTISGIALTGGNIEVSANNVTIKDVSVTNGGADSSDIHIESGVTGTTIEDSTLGATGSGIAYAVSMAGGATNTGLRLFMTNCAECWNGNGALQDSYALSNANIAGAHYEAVYVPGGTTSPTVIKHNTLLNPHDQTAGIFGDNHAYGPMHNVTLDGNLVADGGDNGALVTGCNGDGGTNMVVTNNRLSYIYDKSMPQGSSNVAATTWTNNIRDDTLKAVPATSVC
jgi:hypothetical protein